MTRKQQQITGTLVVIDLSEGAYDINAKESRLTHFACKRK